MKNIFINALNADTMYYQQLQKKMGSQFIYEATLIVETVGERLNQDQTHHLKTLIIESLERAEAKGYERAITDPSVRARLREDMILSDD